MITPLGWEVTNTDDGFTVEHVPCGDFMNLNTATIAGLYGILDDVYAPIYREFVRYHNDWSCRDDLESIFAEQQDAGPDLPAAD